MKEEGGRLLAQSDWEQSYRENKSKYWITYKCKGQPSIHSYVQCEASVNSTTRLTTDHPGFQIHQHNANQFKLSYSDGGEILASNTFKAPTNEFYIHGRNKKVTCLDVTQGGLGLSCAESSPGIKIWETNTGKVRRDLTGHAGDVYRAKFFPSGIVVLSGGADTQLKIWSVETGNCATTMVGHRAGVLDFDFVDRGRSVVSCSRDGTSILWDVSKQRCIHSFSADSGSGLINSCALQQTSAVDLQQPPSSVSDEAGEVGTDGKLMLLAMETRKLLGFALASKQQVLEVASPDSTAINCVSFSTGDSFVIGTEGGLVAVFDVRNLRSVVKTWDESRSAILDLRRYKQGFLYSTADGSAVYIDETLSYCYEMSGADCDPVYQVCQDGSSVYTSCRDGAIRVY